MDTKYTLVPLLCAFFTPFAYAFFFVPMGGFLFLLIKMLLEKSFTRKEKFYSFIWFASCYPIVFVFLKYVVR